MNQNLKEAIESACSCKSVGLSSLNKPRVRYHSPDTIRQIVYAVVRELPDDMTAAEIRDELEISENQYG